MAVARARAIAADLEPHLPRDLHRMVVEYDSWLPCPELLDWSGSSCDEVRRFVDRERHRLFWRQMEQHVLPRWLPALSIVLINTLAPAERRILNALVDRLFTCLFPSSDSELARRRLAPHCLHYANKRFSLMESDRYVECGPDSAELSEQVVRRLCGLVQPYIDHACAYVRPHALDPRAYSDAQMREFLAHSSIDGLCDVGDAATTPLHLPETSTVSYGGIGLVQCPSVPGAPELVGPMYRDKAMMGGVRRTRFHFHGRVFEERSRRHPGYFVWLWDETHTRWCGGHNAGRQQRWSLDRVPPRPAIDTVSSGTRGKRRRQ